MAEAIKYQIIIIYVRTTYVIHKVKWLAHKKKAPNMLKLFNTNATNYLNNLYKELEAKSFCIERELPNEV